MSWLPFGRVPEISPEVLASRLTGIKPFLLDVRTSVEWRSSRIEGAVNVPIQTLPSWIEETELGGDTEIVAICLSAHRSIPAVRLLCERGYRNVKQLAGGMRAWRGLNLPTLP